MSVDITQLVMQKYEINKLEKNLERDHDKLREMIAKLEKQCSHPTVRTDRHYSEGGYDYLSSVTISKTCTICDKVLECYDDPKHKGYHA